MALKDSDFAVVCAEISLRLGSFLSAIGQVTLEKLTVYKEEGQKDVLITSGQELKAVHVLANSFEIFIYNVRDSTTETQRLPLKVKCTNTSNAILSPLHTKPVVLLQCNTTKDGNVAYVIPVPGEHDEDVRSVPADGQLYSSLDGTYILVVKGDKVTIYHSVENGASGKLKILSSEITTIDNLDSDNVRLLGKENGHFLMNLISGLQRSMPGGHPVLSEWVNPSNHYIYLTRNKEIIVVNDSSVEPEYNPLLIADTPTFMLFVTRHKKFTPTLSPTLTPTDPPPNYTTRIVGSVVGSVAVILLVVVGLTVAIIGLIFAIKKRYHPILTKESGDGTSALCVEMQSRPLVSRSPQTPSTSSPEPLSPTETNQPQIPTGIDHPPSDHSSRDTSPPLPVNPKSPDSPTPPAPMPTTDDNLNSDVKHQRHGVAVPPPDLPNTHTSDIKADTTSVASKQGPSSESHSMSALADDSIHPPPQQDSEGQFLHPSKQKYQSRPTLMSNTNSTSAESCAFTHAVNARDPANDLQPEFVGPS